MKLSYFLIVIVLGLSISPLFAQTSTLNTVPEGITTFNIPATTLSPSITFFSAPLVNDPIYTGAVSALRISSGGTGIDTLSVGDSPAPFTTGQFGVPATPYFLKFLSGSQQGRVLLIKSNPDSSSVTLDVTDNSSATVYLAYATPTAFDVEPGDTFEIFAGDTLGSMFGTSAANLVLYHGTLVTADVVNIYQKTGVFKTYYFNDAAGFWTQVGLPVATDNTVANTIIYPYTGFLIKRPANKAATSFVLTGRVSEVNHLVKITGNNSIVFGSTASPVDMTLNDLKLNTSYWATASIPTNGAAPSPVLADTVSIWNGSAYKTYFELSDKTWRLVGNSGTNDMGTNVISAGSTVSIYKKKVPTATNSAASYLSPVLPYTINGN